MATTDIMGTHDAAGGTGAAGSIPAACACHEQWGSACNFGTAGVPCPRWTSMASRSGAVSPACPPGCSWGSPRTGGPQQLLRLVPSPLPASLLPHSASREPAEHPVLAVPDGPWLRAPSSPLASNPPAALAAATALEMLLQQCLSLPVHLSVPARSACVPVPTTTLVPQRPHCHSSPPQCQSGHRRQRVKEPPWHAMTQGTWRSAAASHLPAGSRPGQEKPEIP